MIRTNEDYAVQLFTAKYGNELTSRFRKLQEEFNELTDAYSRYLDHKDSLEHFLDEIKDCEAVLAHIRRTLSSQTHEESMLYTIIKLKVREHNSNYMKDAVNKFPFSD